MEPWLRRLVAGGATLALSTFVACSGGDETPDEVDDSTPSNQVEESDGVPMLNLGSGSEESAKHHDEGSIRFLDRTDTSGLSAFRQVNGDPEKSTILDSIGGGVGLFDVDRDGDLDLYLTNGQTSATEPTDVRDALFTNDGKGRFNDASEAHGVDDARWTMGLLAADLDGDAWRDVYLLNFGANRMLMNREGRFEDRAEAMGIDEPGWGAGGAFGDLDRDGDLDLYVSNYVDFDPTWGGGEVKQDTHQGVKVYYGPRGLTPQADRLFLNAGDGTFSDASRDSGIWSVPPSFGFAVLALDLNEDGWLDLYVANDSEANFLWRNRGDGTFQESAMPSGVALSQSGRAQAGMGAAAGDYDGDGRLDLFVTNFSLDSFTLYRGNKSHVFADVTRASRLHRATYDYLGWACGFQDFDLDGDLDLWMVNGHVYPQMDAFNLGSKYHQPKLVFENDGERHYLAPPGLGGTGVGVASAARGSAIGDVDGDGDVDWVVGNLDASPTMLVNESPMRGRRVSVELSTLGGEPVGTRVELSSARNRWFRVVGAQVGFLSAHDPRLEFGVGDDPGPFTVTVRGLDGTTEERTGIEPGALVTLP